MSRDNERDGDGGLLDDLGKQFDDLHREAQDGLREAEEELRGLARRSSDTPPETPKGSETAPAARASRVRRHSEDWYNQPKSDECRKLAERIENCKEQMERVPEGSPIWNTLSHKRDKLHDAYLECIDREQSARDEV